MVKEIINGSAFEPSTNTQKVNDLLKFTRTKDGDSKHPQDDGTPPSSFGGNETIANTGLGEQVTRIGGIAL